MSVTGIKAVIAGSIAAMALATTAVHAETAFYAGKTIHFMVGYAPGGGSDVMCRVFARHLPKYIPGNPTIVVQNMAGADGATAINYVAEVARLDGLTALCGTVNTLLQLLKDRALRVDINSFQWVIGVPDTQVAYVRSDVKPGMKTAQDLFKAEGLIIGGFRASSSKDIPERLALDVLGVKYKYVVGINGEGAARAALQQNFINFWIDAVGSYVAVDLPMLVKPGTVVPVFQTGMPDAQNNLTKRNEAVPDVPTVYELYRERFGKPPAGIEWQTFQDVLEVFTIAQRGVALPQRTNPAAVAALRAASLELLKDAAFLEDARKVMGTEFTAYDGKRVQDAFARALNPTPEVHQFLIDYVKKGEEMSGL